jgi:outer membrane lipoprotein-sorting protein
MKKNFFILSLVSLALILSACAIKSKVEQTPAPKAEKNTIDISDKNGQEIQATVGDVLYVKLIGKDKNNYEWSIATPEVSEFLILNEHKVTILDESEMDYSDEWQLEITKAGSFDLSFDYGQVNKDPKSSFSVKIISR